MNEREEKLEKCEKKMLKDEIKAIERGGGGRVGRARRKKYEEKQRCPEQKMKEKWKWNIKKEN